MIRCPSGHGFTGPIESLSWEREQEHEAGTAAAPSRAACRFRDRLDDPTHGEFPRRPAFAQAAGAGNVPPEHRSRLLPRPPSPTLARRHQTTPLAAAQAQTGGGTQPANPAGNTQPEPPRAIAQAATALR